jgi:uridine kinase
MFDDVSGMTPQRAALLTSLVRQCSVLLDQDAGMDAAQRLLQQHGVGVIDAILITRQLLGGGPGTLAEAKKTVLTSPARTTELRAHQELVDTIERAQDIANAVLATPPATAGTRIVAIDGAGGSGKTTLAGAAAELLDGCPIIAGDDFYRPMPEPERERLDAEQGYQHYFDWQRLRDHVLVPLRAGHTARYQRFDWTTGELGPWHEITPEPVVIVEGVYTARPELAPYYHLTVYVDTPREVCLQRMRARGQNPEQWITRWRAAEDHYLRTTWPHTRANLVVKGH